MTSRIPYTRPSITDLEVRYATDAAANGWGEKCYDYIYRFERAFRDHLGSKYAVATSSCTGALHMGFAALGIGPGDEVIMPDTGWIATASAITYVGAKPVFVDVGAHDWCIDPDAAERAITPRTKAIVAVHLYGNLCNMERLLAIGEKHGFPIIEDSAEALGSVYHGRRAGTMGRFGAFSFHGTKTITTGEGGMFVTDDTDLYERVLTFNNHGRARGQTKQFWSDVIGYKYKLSNVQAAMGCAQMERIDDILARKREILAYYKNRLSGFQQIHMNPEPDGTVNGAWMPTVVFDRDTGVTRERLHDAFAAANIDARVFFYPLSGLPMFEPRPENRNAWDIPERAFNLPSYHDMTSDDLERVISVVVGCLHA